MIFVDAVLSGKTKPLARGEKSAIDKSVLGAGAFATPTGLIGDEQGDTVNHGGVAQALHHYAFEHYQQWRTEIPGNWRLSERGAFGENISTVGMTEQNVCIGDVYRMGGALVKATRPRKPCWKLNEQFQITDMSRRVQATRRTGWYYRILEPGHISPGDSVTLEERNFAGWTMARVLEMLFNRSHSPAELRELIDLPMPDSLLRTFARRL